ncbi:N-acetyltransferase [Geobacter sulfurreducens]|jgi:amino-acid N-acetyltransferase|uniref:N-acetylglutamate synthase n=1 Tax=Geobacter sulfurreducens (strain ATCC 51573 / DSM 12127 / PCA) TaxID=243231 RepID=Q74BI0_GEOSL|nr:N-acetyltransferase [Geobacter sulfurreducens]AAR35437.1 N-acetylglutamate synthase [Geobacter sulfurreducens PCA]ADI84894.1 N-acetylglutamate synthase [Geobacter sulfurreducens KN400]AJY68287.1 acetyltransferase [Geobacter sulfurreducens]QVW34000.1 N-acetyltransferase [Geobacter sulfurreducens]UAC02789.1 N-acetyltransferase [Geobacter sulfurreducens]
MLRKAQIADVKDIQKLLTHFASRGDMLSRSLSELYEAIRDFYVWEENGVVLGAAALHIMWEDLAEIRSVAVSEDAGRKGIGTMLVQACIDEARQLGLKRVFCLTYKPDFFGKFGMRIVDKSELPHKVWTDCIKCVKFPDCDEIAMILDL